MFIYFSGIEELLNVLLASATGLLETHVLRRRCEVT